MPGTYSQILLHVVFSTKARAAFIKPELQPRLYEYIGGIIRAEKGALYAIGGMPDHVHLLLRWRTDGTIADLMRTVKSRSSLWVHQTFPSYAAFAWQESYAAVSVSNSAEADVKAYIENQVEHHRKRDFQEEVLALLRAHGSWRAFRSAVRVRLIQWHPLPRRGGMLLVPRTTGSVRLWRTPPVATCRGPVGADGSIATA